MNMWWIIWIVFLLPWTQDLLDTDIFPNLIVVHDENSGEQSMPKPIKRAPTAISYDPHELKAFRHNHDNTSCLSFSLIKRIRELGIQKTKNRKRKNKPIIREVNHSNLIHINASNIHDDFVSKFITMSTINARSIKKSVNLILDHIKTFDSDFACVTETWLSDTDEDWIKTSSLSHHGYNMFTTHRGSRGGGIALVTKHPWKLVSQHPHSNHLAEITAYKLSSGSISVTIVIVYRPPQTNIPQFVDHLLDVLEAYHADGNLLVTGDFNIHLNNRENNEVLNLELSMSAAGYQQHVHSPTHIAGNILDPVYTKHDNNFSVGMCEPTTLISDHFAIIAELSLHKPKIKTKTIKVRKLKSIQTSDFLNELRVSDIDLSKDLDAVCTDLNSELVRTLDVLAPERLITVPIRKHVSWYDDDIKEQRLIVRKREHIWKKYREPHQLLAYKRERNRLNRILTYKRTCNITKRVNQAGKDTKALFKVINSELGVATDSPLPEVSLSDDDLSEEFADFFLNKIIKIREGFDVPPIDHQQNTRSSSLNNFRHMSNEEILKIMSNMSSKSCELDPISTNLFKAIAPSIIDIISHIVNTSLTTGHFPRHWKTALVRPLLKKSTLDINVYKNYRPVSNLSFISKLVERCMLDQFTKHTDKNCLMPGFQSAYRANYSTETSLLKICDDILWAFENNNIMMMAVMDLSAAFDTTDHEIFLQIMSRQFNIGDTALQWFAEYLRPRGFKVCINDSQSTEKPLTFSVPQGSCAGAALFTAYCASIASAVPPQINLSGFADDHSIRKSYKPKLNNEHETNSELSSCLGNIKYWMSSMRLKMNAEKTEYIQFSSQQLAKRITHQTIQCGEDNIKRSDCIKYLGTDLDSSLSFKQHILRKCRSALANYSKIRSIRRYLTKETCETLVVSLCLSHIDYNNAILANLPETTIKKLQRVQNMCAKLVLHRSKYDSSSKALFTLHWLPVRYRINYKIALLVFKCMIGDAPDYLKDLLHHARPNQKLRSSSDDLRLVIPRCKKVTFAERAFSVIGPKIWNDLPYSLRATDSLLSFKKNLKTVYFKQAFNC